MKITYKNPTTQQRTSITLNDNMLRLWATAKGYDTSSDDFMFEPQFKAEMNESIVQLANSYQKGVTTFPTLVSYVENNIVTLAENEIIKLRSR